MTNPLDVALRGTVAWSLAAIAAGGLCRAAADVGVSAAPAWETVWFDDFDGVALDRTKWRPEESCWGGGNEERQCYTDRPENIRVADGVLRLIAQRERFRGPRLPDGLDGAPDGKRSQAYTSGKLRTRGLASWTYGRFSARMKLPSGQGTWPAFWMMPEGDVYGGWPLSGEIDIMEAVNLGTPCADCPSGVERRTSGAVHFGGQQPDNTYLFAKAADTGESPADTWRVYAVEWAEGVIQWLVDGEVFLRVTSDAWHTEAPAGQGRAHAPFDQAFYLMVNLAAGGRLPELSNGAGFDPASFPAELQVDWVRVEQCAGDLQTGRSCLDQQEWDGVPQGPWETQAR